MKSKHQRIRQAKIHAGYNMPSGKACIPLHRPGRQLQEGDAGDLAGAIIRLLDAKDYAQVPDLRGSSGSCAVSSRERSTEA